MYSQCYIFSFFSTLKIVVFPNTDVTINYRHNIDGLVYPFIIKTNAQNAVMDMRMRYSRATNCGFAILQNSYSYIHTSSYATNAPKSLWTELNVPLVVRFFLNKYFANTDNNNISGFFNPRGTMYLSNLAPETISYGGNSLVCGKGGSFGGAVNYTHTSNSSRVVTSTTATVVPQTGSQTISTFANTQNCN